MIVCLENLELGIKWWKNYKWGVDIVNSEYQGIYELRNAGLTSAWWEATVNRLWDWKAIRSRKPPNTKEAIKKRGEHQRARLAVLFEVIRSRTDSEPSIADVEWNDIADLFELSFQIKCCDKRVGSPVFGSKMCHFIFPKIFPVIDNLATGVFDYEFYWRGMKDEWHRFGQKEEAVALLRYAIESTDVHHSYPFETKIIELSHIGYGHVQRTEEMANPPKDPDPTSLTIRAGGQ